MVRRHNDPIDLNDMIFANNSTELLLLLQEISNMLWALTSMEFRVNQVWLLSVSERAKRCMAQFKPQVRS